MQLWGNGMRKQRRKLRGRRNKECENAEATWNPGIVSTQVLQPALKPKWKKVGLE